MGIRDRNIDWLRRHVWRSFSEMTSWFTITSHASLAPAYEVGTRRIAGFEFAVAGDFCFDQLMLPFDMDPEFSLKFRLHYTGLSTTAADTYTWKGFYNSVVSAATAADPATAFDTDFVAADNVLSGTAGQIGRTGWGVINALKWTRAQIEVGHMITLEFELDASDATLASEQAYLLGYEYSYVVQATKGTGSSVDVDAA